MNKVYERTENGETTIVDRKAGIAEINHAMMGGRRAVREMSSISRTDYAIEYKDGRSVRLVLVDAPEAPAEEELERCEPVMSGKVHTLSPGSPEGHAFPLCRTGASTNRGTRYRKTTAELTCTTCLTYEQRRKAASAHQ